MKKHIKKALSLVAILVVCVSLLSFSCGAFYIDTDGSHLGVNVLQPRFIIDTGDSYTEDTIPLNLYENSTFISDVIHADGAVYENDWGYKVYYTFNRPYYDDDTYEMAFDTMQVRRNNNTIDADVGLTFEGSFSCEISYDVVNADGVELVGIYSYSSSADGDLNLIDFIDGLFLAGDYDASSYSGYVRLTDFSVNLMDADVPFYCAVQYYHYDIAYSSIPVYPITLDNTTVRVNTYIADVPIGDFLWNSIDGFLSFEPVNGISLYMIFAAIVALPLFIWFLKLFSGG